MANRTPFAPEEWYHCFNRGVDRRKTFMDTLDYERFLLLLYVCNGSRPFHISNLRAPRLRAVLADTSVRRGEPLVEIGGYCLMPNHWHIMLQEVHVGGIALFMQKVCTGYAMYFNRRRGRTGPLFSGTFKSKHLYDDWYGKQAFSYIHCNPIELFEPRWKEGRGDLRWIEKRLRAYRYSSLPEFFGEERLQRNIIGTKIHDLFDESLNLGVMLANAKAYYRESKFTT